MGAEGQRWSRQAMDQSLCPSRRFRRERRQDDSDLLRGAGRREEAGARRGRQRRRRADHRRWRADRLQDRSDARNANPYNADWPRVHLTSALLSKPVALLAATELKKWRDGLLGTMAPSTINRLMRLRECRAGAGRAARQAHSEPGRLGNRTGRSAECASSPQRHPVRRHGARVRRRRLRPR